MTSRKAQKLLFEWIGTDQEFYQSLRRAEDDIAEDDEESIDNGDGMVCYDGINSSKTINEAIQDIVASAPANCLADIYADKYDELDDSDAEDRGAGVNLDAFSTTDATRRLME